MPTDKEIRNRALIQLQNEGLSNTTPQGRQRLVEIEDNLRPASQRRELTDAQIREASQIIFDTAGRARANVFAGMLPMYRGYSSLSPAEQQQAFEGLKDRIQRETLVGYIRRKRSAWGDQAFYAVVESLERAGLIPEHGT